MANFNTRFTRNVSLQGNYSLTYAHDLPGSPSNPYDFAQDWGRSTLDRRHRFILVGSALAPYGLRFSPFVTLQSGAPYDVLLGRDLLGTTIENQRPAFASGPGPNAVATPFGNFNIAPTPGTPLVPRDYLTAAGLISVNVRVSRTFGFGPARNAAAGSFNNNGGGGGGRGGFGGPGGGGPGGGGPRGGGGGGGMSMGPQGGGRGGMFGGGGGDLTEHRFNVTLSVMFNNILNHVNPAGYTGILTSPQFGLPSTINSGFGGGGLGGPGGFGGPGGPSVANNRRIEMSLRLNF